MNVKQTKISVGKLYQVTAADNAAVQPGYMEGRLRDGDLVLCLEHAYQRVHRYAPLWVDTEGVKLYPEAYWFLSTPIGTLVEAWQPSMAEFHRLWGGLVLKGLPQQLIPSSTARMAPMARHQSSG
jgi:hypothetical protein